MVSLLTDQPFAPEASPALLKRLQEIDSRLGFKYLPIADGCWAITEKWGPDDPRRSRIQSGDMPPNADFDVLGYAPTSATADDALDILLKRLRQRVADQPQYLDLLNKVIANNANQIEQNTQTAKDFKDELVEANAEKLSGKIIQRGAGFTLENGKVVGTPFTPKQGLTKSEREARIILSDK